MKLTNTTRMTIEVPKKDKGNAVSYEAIPSGETRNITGVDTGHPKFIADLAARNIVKGEMTDENMPEGTRGVAARPTDTKTDLTA